MTEPTTKAGRALLDALGKSPSIGPGDLVNVENFVNFIEAETLADAARRVEGLYARDDNATDTGYLDKDTVAAVLRILTTPKEAEE